MNLIDCLAGAELGDSLGSFGNGVLGKLTRKHKTDSSLDFSGRKGGLLVVSGELSGFGGDTFEDIVDEGVHDRHTLLGDTGIGVDLLQHLVDVSRVRFDTLLFAFSTDGANLLGWGSLLGGGFGWCLGHFGNLLVRVDKNVSKIIL